ncbi:MAG: EAL domain-containing protein [Geobacteraceae bacterium]|nr:EAL domain-containing protein [Geobacteraceae bacterium]
MKAPRFLKPVTLFLRLLLIVFTIETLVMYLLEAYLPSVSSHIQNLIDSLSLSIMSGPFIWWLIVRPFHRLAEVERNRSEQILRYLVDAVIHFDEHGAIESLNPAALSAFGYPPQEIVGQDIAVILPGFSSGLTAMHAFKTSLETNACRKDGVCFPVQVSISNLQLDGRSSHVAIIQDISEQKQAAAALADQKEFAESLVRNSAAPSFVIGTDRRVLIWNRACEELTGIRAAEMLGSDRAWTAFYRTKNPVLAEIILDGPPDQMPDAYREISTSSFIPEGLQAEGWYDNLNGMDRYLVFNAAPVRNSRGELLAIIESFEDVTERKKYEEQLEYQANHDSLTRLPNRNLLVDRIHQALLMSQRNGHQVAVFFIDLDNFKIINDSLGHEIGDELLKSASERIDACVRAGDTVARQGGDEFVIMVSEPDVADVAGRVAGNILEAMSQPFRINEHELVITCSIGISISPRDGDEARLLIKNADLAMYQAKEQGRNRARFYTNEMNARSLARMTMEKHLRRALERNELFVCYQPKVSLRSGKIAGMEALVRWQSPELGLISPASFIPLAEETGLIEPISAWVLETACKQNRAWQEAGLPAIAVAVNLSACQFRQKNLAGVVERVLRESGLAPRYLELEITESLVMQNLDRVTTILNELQVLGTTLSMDDFGTGYSSLSYLKRFPFNTLKIDQSFVRDITSAPDSAAIAKTIIAMAHNLRLKVIAEGVETPGQLNFLRRHHCDEIQGFLFSKPIVADAFGDLLRENRMLSFGDQATENARHSILVVDDEEQVQKSLQRMLTLEGYRVLTASSAAEGFELLASGHIDLVISDLRMPVMDGNDFLERVKSIYPDVVRIILTGDPDLHAATSAINRGTIFKFLIKPWDDQLLLAHVEEACVFHDKQIDSESGFVD